MSHSVIYHVVMQDYDPLVTALTGSFVYDIICPDNGSISASPFVSGIFDFNLLIETSK